MTSFTPPTDGAVLDVLIVGAGLSGIGAACALTRHCPEQRFAVLEARAALGGTWDLFRYPGVRSDSDMYTLGYGFKPWTGRAAIADGAAIRDYIGEAAAEAGVLPHIRFGQRVTRAAWSSVDACWTLTLRATSGAVSTLRARFLYSCTGYYSYDEAHRPAFDGEADFQGAIALPQFWPADLAYAGKRVVIIGSGATAVTLVPALAATAAHVTMLQRSPSYVVARPAVDALALRWRRWLPERAAYALVRAKNVLVGIALYRLARRRPAAVRQRLIAMAADELGPGYDVATHFSPSYQPWDQRICAVPDGDLFGAIRAGRAEVVTDVIDKFTPDGILLRGGRHLAADVIVLATGLKLALLGGIGLSIDGRACAPGQTMAYKGMMLSEVPNFAMAFGYTNASWTLKADLTARYVCRLLTYMDRRGLAIAVPRADAGVASAPFLSFTSGYVQRAQGLLPRQGVRAPWRVHQNYLRDLLAIRCARMDDGVLRFGAKGSLP